MSQSTCFGGRGPSAAGAVRERCGSGAGAGRQGPKFRVKRPIAHSMGDSPHQGLLASFGIRTAGMGSAGGEGRNIASL